MNAVKNIGYGLWGVARGALSPLPFAGRLGGEKWARWEMNHEVASRITRGIGATLIVGVGVGVAALAVASGWVAIPAAVATYAGFLPTNSLALAAICIWPFSLTVAGLTYAAGAPTAARQAAEEAELTRQAERDEEQAPKRELPAPAPEPFNPAHVGTSAAAAGGAGEEPMPPAEDDYIPPPAVSPKEEDEARRAAEARQAEQARRDEATARFNEDHRDVSHRGDDFDVGMQRRRGVARSLDGDLSLPGKDDDRVERGITYSTLPGAQVRAAEQARLERERRVAEQAEAVRLSEGLREDFQVELNSASKRTDKYAGAAVQSVINRAESFGLFVNRGDGVVSIVGEVDVTRLPELRVETNRRAHERQVEQDPRDQEDFEAGFAATERLEAKEQAEQASQEREQQVGHMVVVTGKVALAIGQAAAGLGIGAVVLSASILAAAGRGVWGWFSGQPEVTDDDVIVEGEPQQKRHKPTAEHIVEDEPGVVRREVGGQLLVEIDPQAQAEEAQDVVSNPDQPMAMTAPRLPEMPQAAAPVEHKKKEKKPETPAGVVGKRKKQKHGAPKGPKSDENYINTIVNPTLQMAKERAVAGATMLENALRQYQKTGSRQDRETLSRAVNAAQTELESAVKRH